MLLAMTPLYYAGGGFPWGFLILGGLVFLAWKNGLFDGFGRRGGPHYRSFGPGPGYGPGPNPGFGPGPNPGFGPAPEQGHEYPYGGPRAAFEEWHRQAHAADSAQPAAPAAPPASPTPGAGAPASDDVAR